MVHHMFFIVPICALHICRRNHPLHYFLLRLRHCRNNHNQPSPFCCPCTNNLFASWSQCWEKANGGSLSRTPSNSHSAAEQMSSLCHGMPEAICGEVVKGLC